MNGSDEPDPMGADDDSLLLSCDDDSETVELEGTYVNLDAVQVSQEVICEIGLLEEALQLSGEILSSEGEVNEDMMARRQDILAQFGGEETEVIQRVTYLQLKNEELRSYALNNIYFGFDSYDIRSSQNSKLTAVMEMLREDDSIELIIKAHADSRGDDD